MAAADPPPELGSHVCSFSFLFCISNRYECTDGYGFDWNNGTDRSLWPIDATITCQATGDWTALPASECKSEKLLSLLLLMLLLYSACCCCYCC